MLCIIAPEYESSDDERQRSEDSESEETASDDEEPVDGDRFLCTAR